MKPTALQLVACVLGGPDTTDGATLAAWARLAARGDTSRRAEVIHYVVDASRGGLAPSESGRGSLKHLLWWLRDHGGSLYEPAARAVIEAALGSTWPLATAAESLRSHRLVGGLARQALVSERANDVARHLTWEDMPRGRVAWNRTALNLSKVAFRGGADWYAAVSREGGCLMGARGHVIGAWPRDEAWRQPYPNLVVLTSPGTLADEAAIRAWLESSR